MIELAAWRVDVVVIIIGHVQMLIAADHTQAISMQLTHLLIYKHPKQTLSTILP